MDLNMSGWGIVRNIHKLRLKHGMHLGSVEGINVEGIAQRITFDHGHLDVSIVEESSFFRQYIFREKGDSLTVGEQGLISLEGREVQYYTAEIRLQQEQGIPALVDRWLNSSRSGWRSGRYS